MKKALALLLLTLLDGPALAAPSFDCAKAEGQIERLVCGDAELSRLDLELARVFGLALAGTQGAERSTLQALQRGWIKGRNECWKAIEDARACVRDAYIQRLVELRREHPAARVGQGLVVGPLTLRCPGLDAPLTLSVVNTEPGAAHLAGAGRELVLRRQPSASGARYARSVEGGELRLWNKGRDFRLERPGAPALDCSDADD